MISAPLATYRIQLRPGFGFAQCQEILPYLTALGVSHVYASPIFKATKGSEHGYDVCDHQTLNPELGSREDFDRLAAACRQHGLGWIQDIVPNHMAVSGDNPMLSDVLESGQASRFFNFFDIEWDHPDKSMTGRMLAPFLGVYYSQALESGEIQLKFGDQGFGIQYYTIRFPVRLESYTTILTHGLASLRDRIGVDSPDYMKFLGMLYIVKNVPSGKGEPDHDVQIYFIKRLLFEMYQSSQPLREFIDANIAAFNGKDPKAQDPHALMDGLLADQHFRLSFWKVAGEEINYRRFFSINHLISLRVEDETVFDHTHRLILELVRNQSFSGLRIDHIDGLYDPTAYLQRLRGRVSDAYLTVEKILMSREYLPAFWPVQGTTGYEFANLACGLFVRRESEAAFQKIYAAFTGLRGSLTDILIDKKRTIIAHDMAGDVDNLARLVKTVSSMDRQGADITLLALKRAITELLVRFPVYRTYISHDAFRPADLSYIRAAVRSTRRDNPEMSFELDFLERFFLLEFGEGMRPTEKREWTHFVMRFQQATGPLTAKALEDSTFYVMNRLLCLNEVGGDPGTFGVTDAAWHEAVAARAGQWPHTMNATETHDTKRGEDARVRLAALSEEPERWSGALRAFSKAARSHRRRVSDRMVPDRNEEYFLYQTILGHYPLGEQEAAGFLPRLRAYLVKAMREAKENSNWLSPDEKAEQVYCDFAEALLKPGTRNQFWADFEPLWKRLATLGMVNSLSQTLLKIAAPGLPDFFQGSELWDFSMVDPDNRRPVDFALRRKLLAEISDAWEKGRPGLLRGLVDKPSDGRIKLFATWRGLATRAARAELFRKGDYRPLEFVGQRAAEAFGFARTLPGEAALAVVPRLFARVIGEEARFPLAGFWEDTDLRLPEASALSDAFTGKEFPAGKALPLREVFADLPFALLVTASPSGRG